MNKFTSDSDNLTLQNAAYQAAAFEASMAEAFTRGVVSEQEYVNAMDATEIAVNMAIAAGISHKDLPAC